MDKYHLRKEIAELIDSIKEHSDNIGNRKRIPQLELELILSKIKKLYEKSIVFNYINQNHIEDLDDAPIPVIPAALEEINTVASEIENTISEEIAEPLAPEELLINVQVEETTSLKQENKTEENIVEIGAQEKIAVEVNAKIPDASAVSLYDKLSAQVTDVSLLSKLRKKPVEDLVKSIGINERYLFTKELFKGNSEAFLQHVRAVNAFNSYEDAQQYLVKEVIPNFNWDANNPAVNEFLDLVQRRFIK
jgi:hypothetical protein